jgi:hypothetical protein
MTICWLVHIHKMWPYFGYCTQYRTVCWLVHTKHDHMLASAHTQDVTIWWQLHTRQDSMLAIVHTQDVTICWLVRAGKHITSASAHTQDGTTCCSAEGHDKSTSLLLGYCVTYCIVALNCTFLFQLQFHDARLECHPHKKCCWMQ